MEAGFSSPEYGHPWCMKVDGEGTSFFPYPQQVKLELRGKSGIHESNKS